MKILPLTTLAVLSLKCPWNMAFMGSQRAMRMALCASWMPSSRSNVTSAKRLRSMNISRRRSGMGWGEIDFAQSGIRVKVAFLEHDLGSKQVFGQLEKEFAVLGIRVKVAFLNKKKKRVWKYLLKQVFGYFISRRRSGIGQGEIDFVVLGIRFKVAYWKNKRSRYLV